MSDSKIVVTDSGSQVDPKYSLILEKLKTYDKYALSIDRLEKSDDMILSVIKLVEERFSDDTDKLSHSISDVGLSLLDERNKSVSISSKIDSLSKSHESLKFDIEAHKSSQDNHNKKASDVHDLIPRKYVSKDSFDEFSKGFSFFYERINGQVNVLSEQISHLKGILGSSIEKMKADFEDFKKETRTSLDSSLARSSDLAQKVDSNHEFHKRSLEGSTGGILSSLSALSNLHEDTTSSAQAVRDDLKKRIESIAIDATNSISRSMNLEQHVKILDKKIESILLTLKKLELSK